MVREDLILKIINKFKKQCCEKFKKKNKFCKKCPVRFNGFY